MTAVTLRNDFLNARTNEADRICSPLWNNLVLAKNWREHVQVAERAPSCLRIGSDACWKIKTIMEADSSTSPMA